MNDFLYKFLPIVFLLIFYSTPSLVYAGGAIQAREQAMQAAQQQAAYEYQRAVQERYMQEQQRAYQQAAQQRQQQQQIAQQRAAQQAAHQAYQQAAVQAVTQAKQQAVAQQQQQIYEAAVEEKAKQFQQLTYQKAMQQRTIQAHQGLYQKMMYDRAVQQKSLYENAGQRVNASRQQRENYEQALAERAAKQNENEQLAQNNLQRRLLNQNTASSYQSPTASSQATTAAPFNSPSSMDDSYFPGEEEQDIVEIWNELRVSSEVWPLMIDTQPKVYTVQWFIDQYRKENVVIKKSASLYVGMIDNMFKNNPSMLKQPFKDILMIVAVTEYDFDNGHDKDQLAYRILGEKVYRENRKRLGLE